uniref:CCHC-type domain-containing protein n=1 Tax=Cajanus cajan TaxID=3821 RepID=A0A151QP33_CAJCA|nr:hypothetical protein KK1_047383 [Cajanus cajan]
MEKIFMVMQCPEERKLVYAIYMLVGEASFWWKGAQAMMEAKGEAVNSKNFKKVFLEKYFPDSARYAKEAEFLRLQQGNMSVQEYAVKFEHLARYYSQAIFEAWRCRKFSEGLRYELKKTIILMGIVEFPVLVEKAKIVERFEGGNKMAKGPEGSSRFGRGKHPQKRPSQFQIRNANKKSMGTTTTKVVQSIRCYTCGGPHMMRDCPTKNYAYFKCGKVGHMAQDCNVRNTQARGNQKVDRPTTAGRVFALTGAEAETSSEQVKGKSKADGNDISILFDSGASHSFISYECVARLNLVVSSLCVDLVVSTPASGSVLTSEVCLKCPVEVEGRCYKVNLFCLPLSDLDVILGMDWLSANRILIYFSEKRLIFPTVEQKRFISSGQVDGLLKGGALGFMILSFISVENEKLLNSIDVVRDFPEVFPDDVPGLPPKRELEFSIDLIPGAGPTKRQDGKGPSRPHRHKHDEEPSRPKSQHSHTHYSTSEGFYSSHHDDDYYQRPPRQHRPRHETTTLREPKFDLPPFHGKDNVDDYLNWEIKVEQLFTCHNVSGEKGSHGTLSFQGYATYWWTSLERERRTHHQPPIQYWNELKSSLRRRHIPPYFEKELMDKLQRLQQRSLSVDEYRQQMELLMMRAVVGF